jgi:hypothetical protein
MDNVVEGVNSKVVFNMLGKDGRALLNHVERKKKINEWDQWVKSHFEEILKAIKQAN